MPEYTGRFESTVPYYARFRPRYPSALYEKVAARCALDGHGNLLDLGCGPGFIAIAMARYFAEVVGIDPEPAMIDAARLEAEIAGGKVSLVRGSSQTLGRDLGLFRMVTMGRSFQWMDRDATLVTLDTIIEPRGAIALFGERSLDAPETRWRSRWEGIAKKFADPNSLRRHWSNPGWEPHEAVLRRSRFSEIERLTVTVSRRSTLDELVGRAYSMSSTSIATLGDRREEFERELRAELLAVSPSGVFDELVESAAVLAFRAQ
jgi:SAM-dependent methyltransferase